MYCWCWAHICIVLILTFVCWWQPNFKLHTITTWAEFGSMISKDQNPSHHQKGLGYATLYKIIEHHGFTARQTNVLVRGELRPKKIWAFISSELMDFNWSKKSLLFLADLALLTVITTVRYTRYPNWCALTVFIKGSAVWAFFEAGHIQVFRSQTYLNLRSNHKNCF